jgi:GAF domain-containing protein
MGRRARATSRSAKRRRSIARPKVRNTIVGIAELREQLNRCTLELDNALQQQIATSEVLSIIRQSPADAQPVFDAIVQSASRLCGAMFGVVYLCDGDRLRIAATNHFTPAATIQLNELQQLKRPERSHLGGRAILDRKIIHVPDVLEDPEYSREFALAGGWRAVLAVPLMRDGIPLGALTAAKAEPAPFSDRQVQLLKMFAEQAVIAIENTRLLNELRESLQQQTATADVLKVISRSTFDLQKVFETLVNSAARLCRAEKANIWRLKEDNSIQYFAAYGFDPDFMDYMHALGMKLHRGMISGRAVLEGRIVHIHDVLADPEFTLRDTPKLGGFRTALGVPLMREGRPIGGIFLTRPKVEPFTEQQITLVSTFADQAVIAIENVRLFDEVQARTRELSESLEQQTATSEVLKVISSSLNDLKPVFEAILENATRICEAKFGNLFLYADNSFRIAAQKNAPPAYAERWRQRPVIVVGDNPHNPLDRLAASKSVIDIPDLMAETGYIERDPRFVALVEAAGARTHLAVPMLKDNELVGAISIFRQDVCPFTSKQIELVQNFAAQAVIAIENARLLNELRQRTDDLSESLEQQTATSEVLKVISSTPNELKPVFDAMLANATRICEATFGNLVLIQDDIPKVVAMHGAPRAFQELRRDDPRVQHGSPVWDVVKNKSMIHIPDITATESYAGAAIATHAGARTFLGVPMLKGANLVGTISIYRQEVRPFTDKQIELVRNFAAQAVIAIENARLLNELRESLQQQTATADVLKVISRSTFDLQLVLDTLVESATRLCEAKDAFIFLRDGELYRVAARYGFSPQFQEYLGQHPRKADRGSVTGRTALEGKVVHVHDVNSDPEYTWSEAQQLGGYRTVLGVPLLRDGSPVGVIIVARIVVQPFTEKQIELVTTFADQAVIAIENVRLFEDVQKRTRELSESLQQQTATADVLKTISRSTFNLRTVLQTLIESAARLCDADKASVIRERNGGFYSAEAYGYSREFMDYVQDIPIKAERGTASGRALLEGHVVHIADVKADPEYTLVEGQRLGDYRTILCVPMLREGVPIGVLVLTRSEVRPFTEKQIELVTTFADQAAIAIENVRLFDSVEARTRELAKSLDDLRTTQDRLVQTQKLASLGQLTAGIAHEIKNPLNFVNNFSGVSAELLDELKEALEDVSLNEKRRSEITEVMDTLRGNLEKVVQHGKRADSIVKNMLLHSREGSGEHRSVDINALVEESLNLAYHGARAEKQGFNITLERSLDPAAGEADVFPQEITRALLNLISNGFYAATKRNAETNGGDYSPTLVAATRNLGVSVEIRIRDNGTGIPAEVKEKIFNPFFTTKPAGEGTGLGLSISHDIIVKQHGGSIEVDTQPGEFTEIRIVLPRAAMLPTERA